MKKIIIISSLVFAVYVNIINANQTLSSNNISLSDLFKSAKAACEAEPGINCNQATNATTCSYKCIKVETTVFGSTVVIEATVGGQEKSCYASSGNVCEPSGCTPINGCPEGFS